MAHPDAAGRSRRAGVLDPERRRAIGSLIVAINDFGVKVTSVLESVGYGAVSSNSDLVVMGTIRTCGPQRPNALAKLTGLTSGGMTNLLDRLEVSGLVVRSSDAVDDGRGVLVDLTTSGRKAIDEIGDVFATHVASAPEQFDEMRRCFAAIGYDIAVLPSSLSDPIAQIGDVLRLAAFGLRAIDVLRQVFDDPTPSKSTLTLWFAQRSDGVRPGQLTELTGLSSAGVSELLERLERRGLIERAAGRPPDRRVVTVTTTDAGDEMLASALAALDAQLDELHANLVAR